MQRKTWSINGLSVELGIDRRTLAKKLSTLRPAEQKGKFRLYYMAAVLEHLEKLDGPGSKNGLNDETIVHTNHFIRNVTAGIFDESADLFVGYFWKATAPFPVIQAEHVLIMIQSIWKLQAFALNQYLGVPDNTPTPTPEIIDALNDPKIKAEITKNLKKNKTNMGSHEVTQIRL